MEIVWINLPVCTVCNAWMHRDRYWTNAKPWCNKSGKAFKEIKKKRLRPLFFVFTKKKIKVGCNCAMRSEVQITTSNRI